MKVSFYHQNSRTKINFYFRLLKNSKPINVGSEESTEDSHITRREEKPEKS